MRATYFVSFSAALTVLALACGDLQGTPIVADQPNDHLDGASVVESGVADSGSDGPVTPLGKSELATVAFGQNCMPVIPSDPVVMEAKLAITNPGTRAVGPIEITAAKFLDPLTLTPVATFNASITLPAMVPAGTTTVLAVTKTNDSLAPSDRCDTLTCGKEFVVELTFSGPGAEPTTVRSAAKAIGCVF